MSCNNLLPQVKFVKNQTQQGDQKQPYYPVNPCTIALFCNYHENTKSQKLFLPGVDKGVWDMETIGFVGVLWGLLHKGVPFEGPIKGFELGAGCGGSLIWLFSSILAASFLAFFSLVPRIICLIVSLTFDASLLIDPLALCLLCFILRFWNQTLSKKKKNHQIHSYLARPQKI